MNLSERLISDVRDGRVVLLLGAGASIGATDPAGNAPLIGDDLRDALCDEFLNGQYKDYPLMIVAEIAASETDLGRVQGFIASRFEPLEPADFHCMLAQFKWHGIATTNYDRIVEKAYARTERSVQSLVPIVSADEQIDKKMRSADQIALLKLHGCVTRTSDPRLPLILTVDQYLTHRENRESLFNTFEEWAAQQPIVFVGHAMQDTDLRKILLQVSQHIEFRPRCFLVRPGMPSEEVAFWASKRITVLDGTFEDFLKSLGASISQDQRELARATFAEHPITRRLRVTTGLPTALQEFLDKDVQYIHEGLQYEAGDPKRFYKGFDLGWYPICENLDVRREATDEILMDIIARSDEDRPTITELYTIQAEAGSGKSIFLKRLAWESSMQVDALTLFLRSGANPDFEMLHEIYRITNDRIFLFIDSAAENLQVITYLIEEARRAKLPLTLFTSERINEWYMSCEELDGYVTGNFTLPYLSSSEIDDLVDLLELHDAEGSFLKTKTHQDKVEEFTKRAGRQLLVALHEATQGKPFEEILLDEYDGIHPAKARSLYLTVCLLNRLGVSVRAGLIARVHKIPFETFRDEFLNPLSNVVNTKFDRDSRDYVYVARHTQIAKIVFNRVLSNRVERYNEYIRVLKFLNLSYSSDLKAFRLLTQARLLQDSFVADDIRAIYRVAEECVGSSNAFLMQQEAIFERKRGELTRAHDLLQKARKLEPSSTSIMHSLAEVARSRANAVERQAQRTVYRNEAYKLLNNMPSRARTDRYAQHTFVLLALDDLKDLLNDDASAESDIDAAIRKVENALERARQRFPEDAIFRTAEAEFAAEIDDHERAKKSLKLAFDRNPRDPYLASRLSTLNEQAGDLEQSKEVLRKALDRNPDNIQLNFSYAKILQRLDPNDSDNLLYHFRKSFIKWDEQYEAQFYYALYAYESADPDKWHEAREIFRRLRDTYMNNRTRHKIRAHSLEGNKPKRFTGTVSRLQVNYGFITRDGRGDEIFFLTKDVEQRQRSEIRTGQRLSFELGYSFSGAQAITILAE